MTGFRARARAVDMLGRQQIANLPTALSELFKNAHDAYATIAIADYYRKLNMLVVRDDGVGMDLDTFQGSWLTIATESKLDRSPVAKPRGMQPRVQLGEKGIGRFAIGALGSQVLVISKHADSPTIAAFVNWQMFELPGIDLDEVPVGLIELDTEVLTEADVLRLKKPLCEAVEQIRKKDGSKTWRERLDTIRATIDALPDDPYWEVPDLGALGASGTAFLISPASIEFPSELDSQGPNEASLFDRTLYGFTDVWLREPTTPEFSVDFMDHRGGGDSVSRLDPGDFFDVAEFDEADHHIRGEFDEDGNFLGTIRVFAEEVSDVSIPWTGSSVPRCGPFMFEVGVVQGLARESMLDTEAFQTMNTKLRNLGGLYVYKDGIRVQPYGRPDVDYLEIEERRSLGAGYYFFSYRRMFGAIRLSSDQNPGLQEKAGREGFTRGRAYSDFRELLMNLLVELAARYFRADGPEAHAYEQGRERLVREDQLRKERDKQAAAGRKKLQRQLVAAERFLESTDIGQEASNIVSELRAELSEADRLQPATMKVADAKRMLQRLIEPLAYDEPEGFAPTEAMRRDMAQVERMADDAEQSYVRPALEAVDELAVEVEARLVAKESDERERKEFIEQRIDSVRKRIRDAETQATQALSTMSGSVKSVLDELRTDFEQRLGAVDHPSASSGRGWIGDQAEFEHALDLLGEEVGRGFIRVANLVRSSSAVFESNAPTPTELAAAADAEIVELREQADAQLEFVQLGMALAVVDHEFNQTVASIRSDVRKVHSWAKKNPQLVPVYEALRRDFDHLDSYLTLLTPMQRRIRRAKTTIKGSDISRFLGELFYERMRTVDVKLDPSPEFQALRIEGYASTFYPVFVNLVDNSLYWIGQAGGDESGAIELDSVGQTIVYRDSGPGIVDDIADRVFDFGFTTKPGGSGLGLAIASQVLDRAGWSMALGDSHEGAEFLISPRQTSQ
ncbi:MAG: hypothetical protein F4Y27_09240 [Acidimicrobiaceae bacterium]|nr:hypothetical protein [Acidimicrobiaceae bacterium]MYG56633.1 hypothetical protein [Acidimicrobiaceae bacterium]MYJ97636.1 hypothetical protein [Acidimicrobiaceae bacterium]